MRNWWLIKIAGCAESQGIKDCVDNPRWMTFSLWQRLDTEARSLWHDANVIPAWNWTKTSLCMEKTVLERAKIFASKLKWTHRNLRSLRKKQNDKKNTSQDFCRWSGFQVVRWFLTTSFVCMLTFSRDQEKSTNKNPPFKLMRECDWTSEIDVVLMNGDSPDDFAKQLLFGCRCSGDLWPFPKVKITITHNFIHRKKTGARENLCQALEHVFCSRSLGSYWDKDAARLALQNFVLISVKFPSPLPSAVPVGRSCVRPHLLWFPRMEWVLIWGQ